MGKQGGQQAGMAREAQDGARAQPPGPPSVPPPLRPPPRGARQSRRGKCCPASGAPCAPRRAAGCRRRRPLGVRGGEGGRSGKGRERALAGRGCRGSGPAPAPPHACAAAAPPIPAAHLAGHDDAAAGCDVVAPRAQPVAVQGGAGEGRGVGRRGGKGARERRGWGGGAQAGLQGPASSCARTQPAAGRRAPTLSIPTPPHPPHPR
jgi:hypothetical protein